MIEAYKGGADVVGKENDYYIKQAHNESEITVVCWGGDINDKNLHYKLKEMRELLPNVSVIKILGNNTAGHPLYKIG